MQILYICAVIATTAALLLIAHREKQFQKFAYGVALAVPILAIVFYMMFFSHTKAPHLPADENLRKEAFLEDREKIQSTLEQKLESDPANPELSLALAHTLMEQTKYAQAATIIEDALKQNPQNADLIQSRAVIYFSKGLFEAENKNYAAAIQSLTKAKQIAPKDAPFAEHIDLFIKILDQRLHPKKPQ